MKKIILSSFLILVVLTSSIYFLMPDKVRIDIENTRTKYSVYEDGFTLAATEYVNLFDGTKKMRASSRSVTYWNDSQFAYAERRSEWKDNITTIQTYTFGIYEENIEEFPLKNEFQCLNCEGKIVHYEIRDILYEGETKNIVSPFSFGHNMNIEWESGYDWAKVYQQIVSDKIIIRYRPKSNDETYSVRLFDPVYSSGTITYDGDYTIHTFTTNGTFNVTRIGNAEVLVLGGGAGGGTGGGGAGGLVYAEDKLITAQNYSITIGAGGIFNNNGGNSTFSDIVAIGGGTGGPYGTIGFNGSSGGGGGTHNTNLHFAGGFGLQGNSGGGIGYGNDGGAGAQHGGGGGGGTGAVGADAVSDSSGGNGGAGLQNDINGTNVYWAAGGGGGTHIYTKGLGGSGIGGDGGSFTVPPTNAVVNTGSGGGGTGTAEPGANGSSGIVIIRYLTHEFSTPTVTLETPNNYTNFTTTNEVDFECYVSEEDYDLINVSLYIDDVLNETINNPENATSVWFNKFLSEGNHTWTCEVYNNISANFTADKFLLNIDTIIPIISIDYPANDSYIINVSNLNYTIIETNPNYCWYSNNSGVTNLSVQTCMTNWTDVISIEGQNTWIVYANDTLGNENQTSITFNKETAVPLIDFASETEVNGSAKNNTFIYANVSVNEANEQNITFELYWQNGTLINSSFYTTTRREINWTDLNSDEAYLYNVTVFDIVGNSNSTDNRTIYLSDIFLFFDGNENDLHIELNTTVNITGNSSIDFGLVCLDIDHPEYGDNYTCSDKSVTTNLTFDYFRKTTFWNGTTSWNFSDFNYTSPFYFTNESLNFTSHQYDEIDDLRFNISSLDNAKDIIFYVCNTSSFDRYYKGFLVGTNIYLNQSVDSSGAVFYNWSNITFDNPGNATVYFYLDDNATIINITMNVTGKNYGFDYFDEFTNWSNIDISETTAQLHYGPGGFIQAPNSSLSLRTFDNFNDASIADHWVYSGSYSDSGYSYGVRETGGYLEEYGQSTNGYYMPNEITNTLYPYPNRIWFFTSDYLSFDVDAYYYAQEDSIDENKCQGTNTIKFANQAIWSGSTNQNVNGEETYTSDLSFELTKINNTYWEINKSGTNVYHYQSVEDCDGTGGLTITHDYTNGFTFTNWADPDCTDTYASLSNSSTLAIDEGQTILYFTNSFRDDLGGSSYCSGINTYLRVDNLKNKMWYRGNGSVISESVFDSASNIVSATMNLSSYSSGLYFDNYTILAYMSADNGDHWESITNGVEKTFDYPGKHMKYRIFFNTTNPGYLNDTAYIENVTIITPVSSVSNLEFDFGNDGIWDYKLNGTFSDSNDTLTISMPNADISNAFSSRRTLFSHMYQIPMRIYSASAGQLNIDVFNITYNPNPVILNKTAIQNFLDDYGSNETNVSITIAGASGTVNVSDIRFDYAGGNSTIEIIVRNILNTMSVTKYIYPYYSRWDYMFVPLYVDFLEFIPRTPTSSNVTPYGQTNSTAILNLTNYGYGDKNANLSVYLNDTSTCVNLTMSTTWDKEAGHQLNSSWIELDSNQLYLNTNNIWLFADYNCSYSTWSLFNPYIIFRQCCSNCSCSEET